MTRDKLIRYLDSLTITSENIGHIRRTLMVPFDCEWNAWVRDETAAREHIPEPNESSSLSQIRIEALKNTVKSLNEQIEGLRNELKIAHAVGRKDDGEMGRLRQELAHVTRHRDFLEGELHKRDEQLDAVKIERDAAEARADALKSELREAHGVVQIRDKRIEELESCGMVMDFAELSAKCELLQEQLQDLAERNVNLRIRQASVHCVLPAYKPQREEMWRRALAIILVKSPAIDSQWGKLSDDMRQFITGIFSLILDTLPQLDVTTRHPSGSSEPGDRNPSDSHSEQKGKSENGQTSIASEGSTTPPVSGKPS